MKYFFNDLVFYPGYRNFQRQLWSQKFQESPKIDTGLLIKKQMTERTIRNAKWKRNKNHLFHYEALFPIYFLSRTSPEEQ